MNKISSSNALEAFGRQRLSQSFFMRDFLYSEISQCEGVPNIPDDPNLAITAGKMLCGEVLEPLQSVFGRIAIRSAYRSSKINEIGANKPNQYACSRNEANYARHIWDRRDNEGYYGATACIVLPSFLDQYENGVDWRNLAWWIHNNLNYSELCFYPKLCAFNISWHEKPKKTIRSYIAPLGTLTKPDMENHVGETIGGTKVYCNLDVTESCKTKYTSI